MLELQSSAADGIEYMQFAVGIDASFQTAEPANVLAMIIDVYVLADVALFCDYAVTQAQLLLPKRSEQIADGFVAPGYGNLRKPVAEALKMAAQIDSIRHNSHLLCVFAPLRELLLPQSRKDAKFNTLSHN